MRGGDPARRELLFPPVESIEMGFLLVVSILGGTTGTGSSIVALGVWV